MKIFKDSITTLAESGHITLQVPTVSISFGGNGEELEELPDEWFVFVRFSGRGMKHEPAIAKEKPWAFLHLSRPGWEANRLAIREAYLRSDQRKGDWSVFEAEIEAWFVEMVTNGERKLARLEALSRLDPYAATKAAELRVALSRLRMAELSDGQKVGT